MSQNIEVRFGTELEATQARNQFYKSGIEQRGNVLILPFGFRQLETPTNVSVYKDERAVYISLGDRRKRLDDRCHLAYPPLNWGSSECWHRIELTALGHAFFDRVGELLAKE